jgi:hypothetical protein
VTRNIFALGFATAIALAIIAPAAWADDAQPTPAQLEKAKKAYGEGKTLFDKGDFPEAVAKFKESYTLSKNPILLYNIAFANESAGQDDIALFYYRKFLTDAPQDAAQRPEVTDRVKVLEAKFRGPTDPVKPDPVKPDPVKTGPVKIKPAGTYSATDFQHQTVETAPPKKPLDVTAFVPEDSGFQVTLYFRTAGEGKFTSKPMRWRYKELVGRIPPEKMLGDSLQYYIEVKDNAGEVVTRAGKSTSPNLVTLEAGAAPRFYPDWNDDGTVETPAETRMSDTDEDPLNRNKKPKVVASHDEFSGGDPQPGDGRGFRDVGSSKFKYMKWGSTAGAGVLVALSVVFYLQAGSQARALEDDSLMCGMPPCRNYDPYDKDLEAAGKRDQTISRVTLGLGIGVAAVAGYYWYKELTAKKRGELKISGTGGSPEAASWMFSPSIGDGFAGAAAATRF